MKYRIITYGCQMNKNDSERIASALQKMGMKKAKDKNSADFIVLNTCSVRQTAEDRVFGEVNNFLKLKKTNPKLKMAITGCVIGRDKDGKLKKKLRGVDLFFKIDELPLLVSRIAQNHTELNTEPHRNHPHLSSPSSEEGEGREGEKLQCGSATRSVSSVARSFTKPGVHYLSIYPYSEFKSSRYLTIQTGCNEFCSYCVVPFSRGREYNRPLKEILKEARKLIKEGAIEITLLGQIVNKWTASDPENFAKNNPFRPTCSVSLLFDFAPPWRGEIEQRESSGIPETEQIRNRTNFAALLWELNRFPNLKRIRFTAPHPRYVDDNFIKALSLPKTANYLHLPAQSGDDVILKKMNRKYTAADYLKIIEKIRKAKPGIALGADLIVGFAGETEKQFKNTVDFYKKADFDIAYVAMYSPRSGTAASKGFADDVPREIKKRRWNALNNLMKKITLEKNRRFVGKTVEVLVDTCEEKFPRKSASTQNKYPLKSALLQGNSREMKRVYFKGCRKLIGKLVDVKIKEAREWILLGEVVS